MLLEILKRQEYDFILISIFIVVHITERIECFHETSRRPYWCPTTIKRRPCWCPKTVLWELNSFLMQTISFVPINLHRCWPREWKHYTNLIRAEHLSEWRLKWVHSQCSSVLTNPPFLVEADPLVRYNLFSQERLLHIFWHVTVIYFVGLPKSHENEQRSLSALRESKISTLWTLLFLARYRTKHVITSNKLPEDLKFPKACKALFATSEIEKWMMTKWMNELKNEQTFDEIWIVIMYFQKIIFGRVTRSDRETNMWRKVKVL